MTPPRMVPLQRLLLRFIPVVSLSLSLLVSLFYVWQLQQPQVLVAGPAEAPPLQCVSYAPYYKPGMTPIRPDTFVDPLQIEQDLKALSQLTSCVRTYSVSQGLDYVPKAAQKLGMKVILGAWIGWVDSQNRAELQLAVQQANQYADTVRMVVVGNEVLLRGEQTEATLRGYLQWAKTQTKVPLTYADVWEYWLKHPTLEDAVDHVTVHILPYWEDKPVSIEQAVAHTASVMGHLGTVFKKPLLIGETGWPSQGRQRFWSQPGVVNEARYLREFLVAAKHNQWQYNIIEAVDQPWKRGLEGTVGGYWGLLDTELQPKFALQGPVAERQDGYWPYLITALAGVLALAIVHVTQIAGQGRVLLVLLAALVALHGTLQLDYIGKAARDASEWLMLGGLLVVGWGLMVLQARAWLALPPCPRLKQALTFLFALALLVTSAALAFNGRYLDFPWLLVLLPLLVLTIGRCVQSVDATATSSLQPWAHQGGWLQTSLLIMAANLSVAVAMQEPGNLTAWGWVTLNGLALYVLVAKRPD